MAKGARASTIKANNAKLKSGVFGPVETARTERLSAKLLALAAQPKPTPKQKDVVMDESSDNPTAASTESKEADNMDIDQKTTAPKRRNRIEKKRSSSRKASIVFPKYKEGKRVGKSGGKRR